MPPTASRNGTAKTVLLRRAIWRAIHAASATTAPMPPDAMFHRSAAKAIRATPCRNRHGVAFVSKAAPFIPPLCRSAAVTASARPPCYSGRSRERPQRRPVNSKEKSRGNFSAPLRRAVNAVSAAAKACSGGVPPIGDKNRRAAPGRPDTDLLPYQSRPCPHICAAPQKQLISQASAAAARRNDFHTVSAASSGHRHCRQPVNDGAIKGRINTAAAPARFWCHSRVGQVVSSTSPRRKHK